jgi:hypothetical protein
MITFVNNSGVISAFDDSTSPAVETKWLKDNLVIEPYGNYIRLTQLVQKERTSADYLVSNIVGATSANQFAGVLLGYLEFYGGGGSSLPTAIEFNTYEKGASVPIAVMPWYIVQGGAPTVNDDASKGFRVGTIWQDVATGIEYKLSDATTGAAVWDVQSGTYTPTLDNATAALSNPTLEFAYFSVQGNVVTATIQGKVDVDFSSNLSGSFDFTLPITAATPNTIGVASLRASNQCNGIVQSQSIQFSSLDTSFVASTVAYFATFQYVIN